jgi:putative hydrolase of the HAD superfamily
MPYHVTWAHEQDADPIADAGRVRIVQRPAELPEAIHAIAGVSRP